MAGRRRGGRRAPRRRGRCAGPRSTSCTSRRGRRGVEHRVGPRRAGRGARTGERSGSRRRLGSSARESRGAARSPAGRRPARRNRWRRRGRHAVVPQPPGLGVLEQRDDPRRGMPAVSTAASTAGGDGAAGRRVSRLEVALGCALPLLRRTPGEVPLHRERVLVGRGGRARPAPRAGRRPRAPRPARWRPPAGPRRRRGRASRGSTGQARRAGSRQRAPRRVARSAGPPTAAGARRGTTCPGRGGPAHPAPTARQPAVRASARSRLAGPSAVAFHSGAACVGRDERRLAAHRQAHVALAQEGVDRSPSASTAAHCASS